MRNTTLTEGIDTLVGTAGDDTFTAGVTGAGNDTLNLGDSVNGGAGTDTMNIFGNTNATTFAQANVTSVERVFSQLATGGAIDVSGNSGVQQAWLAKNSAGTTTVTLNKAQVGGVQGTAGTTATFTFKDATAATGDAATIALDGASLSAAIDVNAIETLTVAATGKNSLTSVSADSVSKLVITGAGSLAAGVLGGGGTFKTVDASANTGGVSFEVADAVQDYAITGGAGDDEVTFTDVTKLTKADKIDLGAGVNTLASKGDLDLSTETKAGILGGVTNVQTLKVIGGTAAVALSVNGNFVSQTSFVADENDANVQLTNIANNANLSFLDGDFTVTSNVGLKLGATTLNVALKGDASDEANVIGGGTAVDGDGLVVTGSSTINVSSAGEAGVVANVLDLKAADNQSVVVTGAKDLTLSTTAATGTTGFSINASEFTGKLNVTGTAAADVIVGGSGDDVIAGGAGADTMTGGAGKDKFVVNTIAPTAAADADVITDFTTKVDTISFGAAVLAANVTKGAAAVADFAAALAAADLVLTSTTATQVNIQQVGSDSYAFYNNSTASGADMVVKLTGVALDGIVAADIVA